MSLTHYNLSEDWGWYIDIESMKPINQIKLDVKMMSNKKFNRHYNKLDTIDEDEFDYYLMNQKNLDDISYKDIVPIKNNNQTLFSCIFNVGSTTMITAILTYVIFFVL